MGQKLLRVAAGYHGPRLRVEKHAVVANRKDARQLMSDNHNRGAQTVAQLQDKIVEQTRADRVQPGRRFVKKKYFRVERHGPRQTGALLHAAANL